jgi:ABC-2 type transport system permease protein
LYRLANALGERVVRFMMNLAIGGTVATVLAGPLHPTIEGLAMLALVLPLAFVLDFTALFIVGLGAFWLESTMGIWLMYSRINMILGGTLLPIEILPERLQPVLRALPFAGMIHAPARIFVSPDRSFFAGTLIRQSAALMVLGLAAILIQRIAVKRIQSNGG